MALIDSGKSFDKEENRDKMKARMENLDVKQYSLRIPANLYKKVRAKLLKEDKSLKALVVEILEDYIKE